MESFSSDPVVFEIVRCDRENVEEIELEDLKEMVLLFIRGGYTLTPSLFHDSSSFSSLCISSLTLLKSLFFFFCSFFFALLYSNHY